MSVRITCIMKSGEGHVNPYLAITHFGWVNEKTNESGRSTREEVYDFIVNDSGVAYVKDNRGHKYFLIPHTSEAGAKYLKTIAGHEETDVLLKMAECGK